jgi:hypothetical protein
MYGSGSWPPSAGSAGGLRKRAGSNPGTAPQADPTPSQPYTQFEGAWRPANRAAIQLRYSDRATNGTVLCVAPG